MPIPIDLLIFDFDGTLTDSIPPAVASIQAMLAELGFPEKSSAEINEHVGFGELPLVSGSIGTSDPKTVKLAQETYYKHYVQEGIQKVPLYPHVKELLELYKNKTKIIVSNKRDEFIKMILKNLGIEKHFAEVFGGDSSPCLKPDPCTIQKILEKYKILPARALLVGDMTVDVETGQNAGIRTCAVTYGFDSRNKLKAAQPDLLIDDLLELKNFIE